MRHRAKALPALLAVLTVFLSAPSPAPADWREFIPRPYENGADLDLSGSYERQSYGAGASRQSWSDAFFKEKLTVYSNGYSFDPRFITYRLSLSGALKQEDFESSYGLSTGWRNLTGAEYEALVDALPEHPYNLRLFSRRLEPLYRQQSTTFSGNVERSNGALFRYRSKPYFFKARYIEESLESSVNSSDTKLFGADGTYYKEFGEGYVFSLNGAYTHTDFDSSAQGPGRNDEYGASNIIRLGVASLTSSVSGAAWRQDNLPPQGSLKTDRFAWLERLEARLPLNFTTDLAYFYNTTDITSGATAAHPESTAESTDKRVTAGVSHLLYRSLRSRYSFLDEEVTSTGGDTKNRSHSLTMNYTKILPRGRLVVGFNLGETETQTSGEVSVPNEPHSNVPAIPGVFLLNHQNVNPASIRVWVKKTVSPFDFVLLDASNYRIDPLFNTFQITVFFLPAEYGLPPFDFVVSYSLVRAEFKLKTDSQGYSVGYELFNNMVNPYYSYTHSRSRVVSGDFPGIPPETTVNTVGVMFQREPFRARAEYQQQDSNVTPYTQWKGELSYTKNVTDTTRVYAATIYTDTDYSVGLAFPGGQAYSIRTAMVSGNVLKQIPAQNLFLSVGGSYSVFSGTTDGSMYTADGSLQWRISKLTLSLGANVSGAESESSTTGALRNRRTRQYYYLNVKRKLF